MGSSHLGLISSHILRSFEFKVEKCFHEFNVLSAKMAYLYYNVFNNLLF